MGGQISWLIPAAAIALVAGLAMTWTSKRTNKARAALIIWGGWLAVTAVTFSYMHGIVHTYYTVALAAVIAAVIGIVLARLWIARTNIVARVTTSAMLVVSVGWSYELLNRTPDWHSWIRIAVVALGAISLAGLLFEPLLRIRRIGLVVATVALTASLLQSNASTYKWAAATVSSQSSAGLQITANVPVMSIGGQTVYDLTAGA